MAWSWSHCADAYDAVRANIERQPREWLEIVWAEWVAQIPDQWGCAGRELDTRKYATALCRAQGKSSEALALAIWEWTEKHATCTNGGWEAHCCPFGCCCHMVPFDLINPEDQE